MNGLKLVTVPSGVVTLSGPVVAPFGTVAWITIGAVTVKLALTPLNVTAVAPVKFVPLSVTLLPTGPLVGVKLVIVGALPTGAPVKKTSKMFEVARWIRESMRGWEPSMLSSAQLQDVVPVAKTHAPLGAW